jgi:hypothetical protein
MRLSFLPIAAALSLSACAPRALFFHESTKVAFAADYNTSDTQPLATSFGYKRRIVAVVPGQERNIPGGGSERNGTNSGEALSLVSKFNVRAGTREGVVITNNFASGMAARNMTRVAGPEAINVLMHSAPIEVSAATGETSERRPATQVVNERLARIMSKRTTGVPASRRSVDLGADGEARIRNHGSDIPPSRETVDLDAEGQTKIKKHQPEVPPSRGTVDLDERGNLKSSSQPGDSNIKKKEAAPGTGVKKANVPASRRSVDLSPQGEAEIKKR